MQGGRSEIQISMLIAKFISHRHGRHSIGRHQQAHIHHRRLHHHVCGRTSFVIRADFSAIATEFSCVPRRRAAARASALRAKGDRKRRKIASAHTVVSHVAPADRPIGRRRRRGADDFVRSGVIIGELLLFYGPGHMLARVFHVPRFAPDEKEAEDEETRDIGAKRKSALTHAGH